MAKPYISATGITNPTNLTLNTSHSASVAIATIECTSYSLEIGDAITIYIGYEGDYNKVFTGYVKQTSKKVPDQTYTIVAHDKLVRAVDYFIVSSNPDTAYKTRNVRAESLVEDVLAMAQITNYGYDATSFTFGKANDVEVNLVSAYDYCKMIADLLTWHLYMDENGKAWFVNRKPHVMVAGSPEASQPGFSPDSPIKTVNDSTILNLSRTLSEKDLRNRVVVYGSEGVYASSQSSTSWNPETQSNQQVLPTNYYKSAVLATYIIDSNGVADDTADYNLKLFNRLSSEISMTVIGDPDLLARRVITVNETKLGINMDYYIFSAEHTISNSGYVVNMLLRR